MKGNWSRGLIFIFLPVLLFVSGCLIISDEHYEERCYTDCYDYEVCQGFCDAWNCWDECWWETTCSQSCDQGAYYPGDPDYGDYYDECYSDVECGGGQICVNGSCQPGDTAERGVSGLCQVCETANDCVEEGALCIRLNYDGTSQRGEQVCGRVCEYDHECPTNFSCVKVSNEVGVSAQCLPNPDSQGMRTCNSGAELECVRANDCAVGESCVNNSCQAPAGVECTSNAGCGAGQRCENNSCVTDSGPECLDRGDCNANEICIDGSCELEAISCVFNSECGADARCVDGQCASTCSAHSECGNNQRCRQGLCEVVECYQSADCSAGQICVEASCVERCDSSADCGFGFRCAGLNYCEPDPQVECRSTAECAQSEICTDEGVCETPCNCNQQCSTGEVCNLDSGLCESGSPADAGQCSDDCDCPSGMQCSSEGQCA